MSTTRTPRVVVGVDDTLAGLQALRFAVAEARRRGVVLRAVRAWQFPTSWWYVQEVEPGRAELVTDAATMILTAFQQAMGGLPHDIALDAQAIEGAPAAVLVDQANSNGDLLVLGRSRRRRFGPSGVDVRCVRKAICPVVTVAAPVLAASGAGGSGRDVVTAAEAIVRNAASTPRPHHA